MGWTGLAHRVAGQSARPCLSSSGNAAGLQLRVSLYCFLALPFVAHGVGILDPWCDLRVPQRWSARSVGTCKVFEKNYDC